MQKLSHLGLFEGIGGFSLAARWMGWETVAWCEWNPFCQKILSHHFPNAEGFSDITKTDFTKYANKIDILTGGFPCQPYSVAGKRKGKADSRHLWPEMLRAIGEVQPAYIVGENVGGLLTWNGGLVFNEVQTDLEAKGYEVQSFVLPACAVNAPHRRDRVWIVAKNTNGGINGGLRPERRAEFNGDFGATGANGLSSKSITSNGTNTGLESVQRPGENGIYETGTFADSLRLQYNSTEGSEGDNKEQKICEQTGDRGRLYIGGFDAKRDATDTDSKRQPRKEHVQAKPGRATKSGIPNDWQNWPTVPPVCAGNDGISPRLDGITFPKWRNESIKAAGNAIVPQVALQIFKAIESANEDF